MICPQDDLPLISNGDGRAAVTPPWRCDGCAQSWWDSELTESARQAWDSVVRDFDLSEAGQAVRAAVALERGA